MSKIKSSKELIRALDADLPELALQAAMEIDDFIAKRSDSLQKTRTLAARFPTMQVEPHGPGALHLDSVTVALMSDALNETVGSEVLTSEQLIEEASKITGVIDKNSPPKRHLEKARNFFVALSRCAAAYQDKIYDTRASHPYRT